MENKAEIHPKMSGQEQKDEIDWIKNMTA